MSGYHFQNQEFNPPTSMYHIPASSRHTVGKSRMSWPQATYFDHSHNLAPQSFHALTTANTGGMRYYTEPAYYGTSDQFYLDQSSLQHMPYNYDHWHSVDAGSYISDVESSAGSRSTAGIWSHGSSSSSLSCHSVSSPAALHDTQLSPSPRLIQQHVASPAMICAAMSDFADTPYDSYQFNTMSFENNVEFCLETEEVATNLLETMPDGNSSQTLSDRDTCASLHSPQEVVRDVKNDSESSPDPNTHNEAGKSDDTSDCDYQAPTGHKHGLPSEERVETRGPNPSQRRRYTTASVSALSKSKVRKKTKLAKFTSKTRRKPAHISKVSPQTISLSSTYPCAFHHFGCKLEFPNKNEWKRHVAFQHLRLWYYRCDLDSCNPDLTPSLIRTSPNALPTKVFNDFNRKDLFNQHLRRMHGPSRNSDLDCTETQFEYMLTPIRERCWHIRRHAPSRSSCPFCHKLFSAEYDTDGSADESEGHLYGPAERAWEERMEHLGRHYEKDAHIDVDCEEVDDDLVQWGLENGVLRELDDGTPWLVDVACQDEIEDGSHRSRQLRRAGRRSTVTDAVAADEDAEGEYE